VMRAWVSAPIVRLLTDSSTIQTFIRKQRAATDRKVIVRRTSLPSDSEDYF
jgi:hypothetical protein